MWVDFGLIDQLSRYKRQPNDGDNVFFFFRPQDILHGTAVIMLLIGYIAASIKRVDSEYDTEYTKTYLVFWNLLITVIPLSAVSLIFYFQVLRWGASDDPAFIVNVISVFVVCCLELLYGGYPAEFSDIFLPAIVSFGFILYTMVFSKMGIDLYVQLDWKNDPKTAATNALIFEVATFATAAFTTFFAVQRNKCFNRNEPIKYSAVESHPLKGGGLA